MLVTLTTSNDHNEAERLAELIVGEKLAACVQILPRMTSVYFWDGAIQKDDEFLLLIKTLPEKYDALEALISANHSYEVPEIVAIESTRISAKYRDWLQGCLR